MLNRISGIYRQIAGNANADPFAISRSISRRASAISGERAVMSQLAGKPRGRASAVIERSTFAIPLHPPSQSARLHGPRDKGRPCQLSTASHNFTAI